MLRWAAYFFASRSYFGASLHGEQSCVACGVLRLPDGQFYGLWAWLVIRFKGDLEWSPPSFGRGC